MRISATYRFTVSAAAVALFIASEAHAQTGAPSAPAEAEGAADANTIGEILVTARKREESVFRIPEVVNVVGEAALNDRNITGLNKVQLITPAFTFNQVESPTYVYMSVRGINSVRNTENPVSLVIDGVQSQDPSQINQQLEDIARIEILKGPQGSLYGRNAVGGAINIVTQRPTDHLSGSVKFTYSNGDDRDLRGVISGPIADGVKFRIGGTIRDYAGLINNVTLRSKADFFKEGSIFGKLYLTPSEDIDLELRASHYHLRGGSYYYKLVGINDINNEDKYDVDETPQGLSTVDDDELSAKLDVNLGFAKLTSVSAYSHNKQILDGDLLISKIADGQLAQIFDSRAFNQDIRLTSNGSGPLRWVVGAYYFHKRQNVIAHVFLGPAFVPGTTLPRDLGIVLDPIFDFPNEAGTHLATRKHFRFGSESFAGYGQADYDISSQLTLTAGIRYDREKRTAFNYGSYAYDFGVGATVPVAPGLDIAKNRSRVFSAWQPKVSIAFKPTSTSLFYGTVSRGFRSGGFNNTIRPAFATFESEKLDNYEIGTKLGFFNGRLRFEAALFHMIDHNRPDFFFFVGDATQNIFNIKKTRIDGVEATISAVPLDGLQLTGGVSFLDTKILAIDTSAIDPDPTRSGLGKHPSYVYHTQVNASAQYTHDVGNDVEAVFGLDFSLKADNWFWYSNTNYKQEPIPLFNGRIAVRKGGAEIKAYVDNIFNFSYVTAHDPFFAFGFPQDDAFPAPPRRYGVSLSYKF